MTIPELLAGPEESVRLRAVRELAEGHPAEAVPLLIRALDDRSRRVRQAAVEVLVQRGGLEVVGAALAALHNDHGNLGILNGAIQILAQAGVDTLTAITAFLSDTDASLRTAAALTLGAQNDTRAAPALLHALEDADPNVRYHAIEALGRLRASEAVDALAAVAESGDFFLAFPALDALATIGDPRVAYRLTPLLDDELLRPAVLEALGQLGNEETVAPLAALLNAPGVPAAAVARALARLHDRLEELYSEGAIVVSLARQVITSAGVQNLLDALQEADGPDLQALAVVLGWPESMALERSLAHLLGRPAARPEVVETLVRKGPRVTELLIEQLRTEDGGTRQAAILALGRLGDARAVPALLEVLSQDEETAISTAGALAMIGDCRAYDPLLGLLGHDDPSVRRAIISALNSLGHPGMAADMARLLADPEPLVRESAVRIVGYAGYPECADLLLERCRDELENVRRAAVESLPCLEDPRVVPALAGALGDESADVRGGAARAAGQLDGAEAGALLRQALDDPDPWVRYFAARSAGRQQVTQALDLLTRLAQTDEAMQVRVAAVEAIGQIGPAKALPILIHLAGVPEGDLARAAFTALAATGRPEALPPLLAPLASSDNLRRIGALRALGECGRAEAVGAMQQVAAGDANADVAEAAINGLARLAAPEALDALVALTALPSRRAACVAALARSAPGRLDQLGRGLHHQRLDVRRAVVEALARVRDPAAAAWLRAALGDAEGSVRLAALTALAHTNPVQEEWLAGLAWSDPDRAVRRAAQARLRR